MSVKLFPGMVSAIGFLAAFAFMALAVELGGWPSYWRGFALGCAMIFGGIALIGGIGWLAFWMSRP